MPEYLSKEEVKQWRSSLEKITLEEYAARLGKLVEGEKKQTNDLIDIVFKNQQSMTVRDDLTISKGEKITSIAKKTFELESSIQKPVKSFEKPAAKKTVKNEPKENKVKTESKIIESLNSNDSLREEVNLVFKKALTDREQTVFEYFAKNKNQIVYAKDLASLLDLPRDYVYKYIKNLRTKISGDNLKNADNGGYILTV